MIVVAPDTVDQVMTMADLPNRSPCGPCHLDVNVIEDMESSESSSDSRRVHFSPAAPQVCVASDLPLTDAEAHAQWWTCEELEQMKHDAKKLSLLLRGQIAKRSCHLTMAHLKTTLILDNDMDRLLQLKPSSPDQELMHWCMHNDGRRGLERFASIAYHHKRKEDCAMVRSVVMEGQAMRHGSEMVAQAAHQASRRARTFALFLGEADARTAELERSSPMHRRPQRSLSKKQQEKAMSKRRPVKRNSSLKKPIAMRPAAFVGGAAVAVHP